MRGGGASLKTRKFQLSNPTVHVVQGLGSTVVLFPFIGENAVAFGLSVILIDVDHIIQYTEDTKSLDPKGFFAYFNFIDHNLFRGTIDKDYFCLNIFHTIECYLLLLFYGNSFPIFYYVLGGFLFHHLFDQIHMIKQKVPFARAFSILEYYLRKKNKITSMREILKKEQVSTTEFPDIATWIAKWGMEEV